MQLDTQVTDIMFRFDTTKGFKGTIFAVFPHEVTDNKGSVATYQHVGQHSSGDYHVCLQQSRPATEAEYAELKKEMEREYGYNINVVKKRNYKKYLASLPK